MNYKNNYDVINFVDRDFKNVNSFLVIDKEKNGILFDCWKGSVEGINKYLEENNVKLSHIFLGHGHYEHINGLEKIYIKNNDPCVYIGADDLPNLYDAELNQSAIYDTEKFAISDKVSNIKAILKDSVYKINGLTIKAFIRTSHTTGSIVYEIEELKMIFTGDALFCSQRTTIYDEELTDAWDDTLRWVFKAFPKKYIVMPGHHEYGVTLKQISKKNPYVKEILKNKK
ncbi:MBL fold metallo-hydrolase [Spiroplasma endosymbiont of Aspidapion aeneum]|uniref:MBL fold metallo-hydrolase n=1 Tax=Spiroplasma endosymbiont of Aspidapion aeneum TaxID=3066276 RepID=UPI00313E3A18